MNNYPDQVHESLINYVRISMMFNSAYGYYALLKHNFDCLDLECFDMGKNFTSTSK